MIFIVVLFVWTALEASFYYCVHRPIIAMVMEHPEGSIFLSVGIYLEIF